MHNQKGNNMSKDKMIKLRIENEKVDWLKRQPNGMSATIRALIANEMAVDKFTERRVRNDNHYQGRDRRSA